MKNRCREQKTALRKVLELKHDCDQSQDERLLQWGEVLAFVFLEFMGARTTGAVEVGKQLLSDNPIASDGDRTQVIDLVDSALNAMDNVDTAIAAAESESVVTHRVTTAVSSGGEYVATEDRVPVVRDPETGEFVDSSASDSTEEE